MTHVVIGAGIAGLSAARVLRGRGRDVVVFEAGPDIGGRVATELVDGFRCDRGFQLLNPSYPAARRALDLGRLDLHRFGRGAAVRSGEGLDVVADPTRHPRHAPALLTSPLTPPDVVALLRWLRASGDDSTSFADSLAAAAFSGGARRMLEQFFSGVTLDPAHGTAAAQVRRLALFFAVGTPAVPSQGMAAIPQQLAEGLRGVIRLDSPVSGLRREGDGWVVALGGHEHRADGVVLAADPVASAQLLGRPEPTMLGVTTWWFGTSSAPSQLPFLHLDIREGARIANTGVLSNVAPSYAPAGQHLVQVSAVGSHGLDDEAAAQHSADVLGADAGDWRLLVRHDVDASLPAQPPGVNGGAGTGPGLEVAGDAVGASIQDALASGRRAAERLLSA